MVFQAPKQSATASKRKLDDGDGPTDAELVNSNLKQLEKKHYCNTHSKLCYVSGGMFPTHEDVDQMALGYWARMMVGSGLVETYHY